MDSRGGGTIRNMGLLVVIASVLVLGYRYTKLLAKFEEQNFMLNERQYEIRSVQEENDGMQKQLADCENRKDQCTSDLDKVRAENQEKVNSLDNKVKETEKKVGDCEKQKNEIQGHLDACNKDKETQLNELRKEKDEAQKKVGELQAEIGKLNDQLKAAQEANKPAAAAPNPPAAAAQNPPAAAQNPPAKAEEKPAQVSGKDDSKTRSGKEAKVRFDPDEEVKRVGNHDTSGKITRESVAKVSLLKVNGSKDSKKLKEQSEDEENEKRDVTKDSVKNSVSPVKADEKKPDSARHTSERVTHHREQTSERDDVRKNRSGPPSTGSKEKRAD